MLESLLIHGLFGVALAYLVWRFVVRRRRPGCGDCPSCPAQATQTKRSPQVTLTIQATRRSH